MYQRVKPLNLWLRTASLVAATQMHYSARPMGRLAAVVFDMDGVLIDSEPFWRQAEIKIFGAHGFERIDSDGAHHGPWSSN